ncbi:MAG TPA: RNA-binding cell elongation regulator Jag/EloR [Acidimicrobiales bacterium]|nr:RNA-binding cell elongation regulator Jag/EloR [Acidimicrobiales bacterium]
METTGRTVQEAKDRALDELGVDEADAEFEVLAEAQTGLFGRLRSEARVRARVRPTAPRSKEERRPRDRRRRANGGQPASGASSGRSGSSASGSGSSASGSGSSATGSGGSSSASGSPSGPGRGGTSSSRSRPEDTPAADAEEGDDASAAASGPARRRRNRSRGGSRPGGPGPSPARAADAGLGGNEDDDDPTAKGPEVEVDLDQQGEVAAGFLSQLTAEFGLDATVSVVRPDEDTVEIQLAGSDLGILIGPKGSTLLAVQNLTRTVVFNQTGGSNGHINVDVGGYRQKRTEALARFAEQVAEQVKGSGQRTALEPMSAVDRKVVHDTISGIDGVSTVSEGEEPRRRVVVLPG